MKYLEVFKKFRKDRLRNEMLYGKYSTNKDLTKAVLFRIHLVSFFRAFGSTYAFIKHESFLRKNPEFFQQNFKRIKRVKEEERRREWQSSEEGQLALARLNEARKIMGVIEYGRA